MAFGKHSLFALAIAAAVGGPIAATKTQALKDSLLGPKADVPPLAATSDGKRSAAEGATVTSGLPLEGPRVSDLAEVFRFDIKSDWIMGRWGRVSTSTPEADLRGYRVPLVTGPAEHDLAGSLTYYFDRKQQVQRIVFRGTTGDARPLVALMTDKFGLWRQLAADPGLHLYQLKRDGKAPSELRIRPAPIVAADNPHGRFFVELWLARPDEFRMLGGGRGYTDRLGP